MPSIAESPVLGAPIDADLVPVVKPQRSGLDTAGIVTWLVMLALTIAFLAAVGVTALL